MSAPNATASLHIVPPRSARDASNVQGKPPLEIALEALEGRYRPQIVWGLFWGARPFSELMRHIPDITKKALRRELAEMEKLGLVSRYVRPGSNRRAEYSLSPLGETLRPLVGAMYEWGLLRLRLERRLREAVPGAEAAPHGARLLVPPDETRPRWGRPLSGKETAI
jgi:DNA-binding HxlR family transcriptional regulator